MLKASRVQRSKNFSFNLILTLYWLDTKVTQRYVKGIKSFQTFISLKEVSSESKVMGEEKYKNIKLPFFVCGGGGGTVEYFEQFCAISKVQMVIFK